MGLHRPWITGVRRHRHRRGAAAAAAGNGAEPRRGPAGGGEARPRAVTAAGTRERGPGTAARVITPAGITDQDRGSCRHRSGDRGRRNGPRPRRASRRTAGDGSDVTALICIHLPLRPAAANQRAPLTCCGRTRARRGRGRGLLAERLPRGAAVAAERWRAGASPAPRTACAPSTCSTRCVPLISEHPVGLCSSCRSLPPPGLERRRGWLRFSRRDVGGSALRPLGGRGFRLGRMGLEG